MTVTDGPAVDLGALRRKYAEERAKRLRPDGNDQYLRLAGPLGHYLTDPYTPRAERPPKTGHVTAAFIGGGFAGLLTTARRQEQCPAAAADLSLRHPGGFPVLRARKSTVIMRRRMG